jgi:hypothetical protein
MTINSDKLHTRTKEPLQVPIFLEIFFKIIYSPETICLYAAVISQTPFCLPSTIVPILNKISNNLNEILLFIKMSNY